MTDERWQRVKEIFEAALDRQGEVRVSFLDEACAGDAKLRIDVESLVEAASDDSAFLESGAAVPPSLGLRTHAGGRATIVDEPVAADDERGRALPRKCPVCGARYDARRRVCALDGTVLDDDIESLVGTTFDGRFRIEAFLGRGGMGVVLRARDVILDDTVAIKLLDVRYASDPSALRRFVREGQIARRFHHPAVVGLHDLVCGDTGPVYLVLEYVDGRTLGTMLRESGQFSPREAVEILRPIADALDAAHALGIIHRDLKPDNIMVRTAPAEPRAKLLDLGIAIMRATADQGADTRLTRHGQWIGTPLYMSPEQWNSATADSGLDGRADVYALGVVTHQLVAGATPFTGDIGALRALHLEGRPRRLDSTVAGVPRAFADAVVRAMSKDRADRFATAGDFVATLETALGDTQVGAGATSVGSVEPGAPTNIGAAAATGEFDRRPGNVPAQATRYIAPEGAVESVVDALERARCVTLTGPGGIGKTRLSLEVAASVDTRFPDGTWFIELAAITDPALVPQAVAKALGARERPGELLENSIHERIGDARLLVVLDNCEHVVGASAALAADLLRACPRASVLATSREALAIPGETVLAVSPLAVPATGAAEDALRGSTAIQLFLDRASAAAPAFTPIPADLETIGAICRQLDGLPLAIELAAARVRALGLGKVLARLDDRFKLLAASERGRPSRQRTLHATIDWSFQMLAPAERALLGRLAVFASGATLEAVELVCPDPGDGPVVRRESVSDLVEGLVAKSLVVADLEREPVRYRMFESIRAFALESLGAAGEREAIEWRVDEWVISMARACGEARSTPDQAAHELQVLAELDTVRQSLERLSRRNDGGSGFTAAAAWLGAFFESHGLLTEGRAWLDAAVASGDAQADRGLALFWSGVLAVDQGDYTGANTRLEAALADARESGDRPAMARVLRALAYLAMRMCDEPMAVSLASEAVALYCEQGDESGEASATHLIATVAMGRGDYAAARPLLERTEALHRRRQDERSLAIDCYSLGEALAMLGFLDDAERYAAESVAIAERLRDAHTLAYATYVVGWVASERGDSNASLSAFCRALGLARSVGDDSACAYSIEGIAGALAMAGNAEVAVVLAAASSAYRHAANLPHSSNEQRVLELRLAPARAALSPDVLATAESRGAALSFGEAVSVALDSKIE